LPTIQLAVHFNASSNTFAIYAAFRRNDLTYEVFRSTNTTAGGSWVQMDNTPALKYYGIAADPQNANIVYMGGQPKDNPPNTYGAGARIFEGNFAASAGSQWSSIAGPGASLQGTSPHSDSRSLIFDPADGTLLNTCDGGIYKCSAPSDPQNRFWDSLNANLRITEFLSVAYDTVNGVILGGSQDNDAAVQSGAGSSTWDVLPNAGGDGGMVGVGVSRAG